MHPNLVRTLIWCAAVLGAAAAIPSSAGAPRVARVLAAGDIASCSSTGDEATAALLDRLRGTVAVLGDSVYERGTDAEFGNCYAPTWGRHRARTRPAVGNHEYGTPGAAGYFGYFGRRAGPRRGYYAYRLGAWHVLVLNTNCGPAGGCERGSPQERWLRAELATRRSACTLAYGHHPRFSSGLHGSDRSIDALWRALVGGGVDVYLSGHDHHYERFRPLGGVRQFVVGTGGRSLYPVLAPLPASERHTATAFGVLALELRPRSYTWRFVPAAGSRFQDSGRAACR